MPAKSLVYLSDETFKGIILLMGKPCPLCGKGVIIKGKTAYGCSNWKSGCQYRQPFSQM